MPPSPTNPNSRVVSLGCLNDPKSYADSSIAASRVSLAGRVKGEGPDQVKAKAKTRKNLLLKLDVLSHRPDVAVQCCNNLRWEQIGCYMYTI